MKAGFSEEVNDNNNGEVKTIVVCFGLSLTTILNINYVDIHIKNTASSWNYVLFTGVSFLLFKAKLKSVPALPTFGACK